jgi:hypothetical protein
LPVRLWRAHNAALPVLRQKLLFNKIIICRSVPLKADKLSSKGIPLGKELFITESNSSFLFSPTLLTFYLLKMLYAIYFVFSFCAFSWLILITSFITIFSVSRSSSP